MVDSTDVVLQNMTMDFDLIKANFVFGVMGLSAHPVLNAIGRTTALGIALAFLLAPISLVLVGRRSVP